MIRQLVDQYFLDHPRGAGQRYFQHLWFAWRFGGAMFRGACAAFLHGVLPNVHQTTASRTVNDLHERLHARHTKTLL